MNNSRKTIAGFIGLISSLIAIFVFITGFQDIPELLRIYAGAENQIPEPETPHEDGLVKEISLSGPAFFYVKNNERKMVFDSSDEIFEAALSPDKRVVVGIGERTGEFHIVNIDGSHRRLFRLYIYDMPAVREFRNLTFVSNDTVRMYIQIEESASTFRFTLENFPLGNAGVYELQFDEFNYLLSVNKVR